MRDYSTTKYLKQIDEDHDDIYIKDECAHYIVVKCKLVTLASHYQLGVHYEINSEQEDSKSADDHLKNVAIEYNSKNTEDKEGHCSYKNDAPLSGEVCLGSASVSSTGSSDGNSANGSTDNGLTVLEVVAFFIVSDCLYTVRIVLERVDHANVCH